MEPAKLTRLVRGELDWIVMKALEKDRNRRYETANSLAQDVERYLTDEPVQACPPSLGYRLRKFVRRHKRALATLALLSVMVLLTIVALAITNVRIERALDDRNQAYGILEGEKKKTEDAFERETAAKNGKSAALEEERKALYSYRIALAHREWQANRVDRTLHLLGECPERLRDWEWHYLNGLCHKDLLTFRGHTWNVADAVFSPDGQRVAAARRSSALGNRARGPAAWPSAPMAGNSPGRTREP
jgi:hypothetical protein